jgi:CBS domain-containing protein
MRAIDVMVRDVITIGPDDSIADAAKLIADNDASALPVVGDGGYLVAIISEGDLMSREEIGAARISAAAM